jgi:hypothetical protein
MKHVLVLIVVRVAEAGVCCVRAVASFAVLLLFFFVGRRNATAAVRGACERSFTATWHSAGSSRWIWLKSGFERADPLVFLNPPGLALSFLVEWMGTLAFESVTKLDAAQAQFQLWGSMWQLYVIGVFAPLATYLLMLIAIGLGRVTARVGRESLT